MARRASRMARTEAEPEMEYFAHLVLARVRRLAGRPYLATRILTALSEYAPADWHGWIGWELSLAGGLSSKAVGAGPVETLRIALGRVVDGARVEWRSTMVELTQHHWPLVATDAARLAAAIDPEGESPDLVVTDWRAGATTSPPYGSIGVADAGSVGAIACVLRLKRGKATRFLRVGLPLVLTERCRQVAPTPRRNARVDTMLAVLALAPEPVTVADLFRAVWGFSFSETMHGESLAITLHRARERLDGLGAIEHEADRLRLVSDLDLVVPDPRCTPDADERVLQYIAKHRKVGARDVSRALGISLRAVQDALKSLVEAGVCERHREGRAIVYGVEDTTFREPTAM